jgi:hypothetical protein
MPHSLLLRQVRRANARKQVAVRAPKRWLPRLAMLLFSLFLACNLVAVAFADSFEDRRVRTGARIFRSLLAADIDLAAKAKARAGLRIWVVGKGDTLQLDVHELIASQTDAQRSAIQTLPVKITGYQQFDQVSALAAPVAVFFASAPKEAEFKKWLDWSAKNRTILFSPFEGHVERGMTAGISIQAKVQPLLNQSRAQALDLKLKPFFLRVSKVLP